MATMNIDTDINDHGLTLRVKYDYTPADPGRLYGPPEHCYPASCEEIDITSVTIIAPQRLAGVRLIFDRLPEDVQRAIEDDIRDAVLEDDSSECVEPPDRDWDDTWQGRDYERHYGG